jgi:molybdate transport system substrate-binding protein
VRWLALLLALVACNRKPEHISVGVAAVMRHAMPDLIERFRERTGISVDATYGPTDAVAEQARSGVRFDVIVLADAATVDELITAKHVVAPSRTIATNTIVLVGPRGSGVTFASLSSLPEGAKIAIGDPATVPAGRYAKRYFETIGTWEAVQPRLIYGGDVAGVLALAQQGRAQVAVVYRSDVPSAAPLTVLDEPADSPTASVVAGIGAHSRHAAAARGFLEFLEADDARDILVRHGFTVARR